MQHATAFWGTEAAFSLFLVVLAVFIPLALWTMFRPVKSAGTRQASSTEVAPLLSASAPSQAHCKPGAAAIPSTTLPWLGNTLDMIKEAPRVHHWLAGLAQEFDGRPVRLQSPGRPDILLISTPEQFETVQKLQLDSFIKGPNLHEVLNELMGGGIFTANGANWKMQRQILVKLFSARTLRDHITPIIQKNTRTLLSILDCAQASATKVDLYHLLHQLMLDTFVELAFGIELECIAGSKKQMESTGRHHQPNPFEKAFNEGQLFSAQRFALPAFVWKLQRWLNVGNERKLRESIDVINKTAYDLIYKCMENRQQQREEPGKGVRHLVDMMLDVADAEGIDITPTQIRDMVVNSLVAGRDTTAETLSWVFHILNDQPRVVQAVREELHRAKLPVNSNASEPYIPTMEDVAGLPYLEATLREVLRLSPTAAFTVKHCAKDAWIPSGEDVDSGVFVRAGTDIALSPFAMGRLTRVWGPDANEFRPERFLDAESGKLLPMSPFRFCAFSAGPRVCVGQTLAMLQLKIILSSVLLHYDVTEVPGQDITYTSGITLPMKNPFWVIATPADSKQ